MLIFARSRLDPRPPRPHDGSNSVCPACRTETRPRQPNSHRSRIVFTLWGQRHKFCDGVNRREFLRLGALGPGGLTLADLLRHEARAQSATRPKSLIYIVLGGG